MDFMDGLGEAVRVQKWTEEVEQGLRPNMKRVVNILNYLSLLLLWENEKVVFKGPFIFERHSWGGLESLFFPV